MKDFVHESNKNENQSIANDSIQKKSNQNANFIDNSPEAIQMRQFQTNINNSEEVRQMMAYQDAVYQHETAQLQENKEALPKQKNNRGLPDNLKTGIENLSGYSMDDVKVHRNSDKPAQLQAHAYAQGTDIHLGPGQEKHLPHEAWHVVQQKQGRVKPTMQMKGGVDVNDDGGLEKEADVMGAKALQMKVKRGGTSVQSSISHEENKKKSVPMLVANPMITQLVVQKSRSQLIGMLKQMMTKLDVHPKRVAYMETTKQGYLDAQQSLQQIASDGYSASTSDLYYAKVYNTWRRNLGIYYKDLTPPTIRDIIYKRNIDKYGDKLGPTMEYLLESNSPIDIILSSTRPNEDVGGTLMKMIERLNLSEDKLEKLIREIDETNCQI